MIAAQQAHGADGEHIDVPQKRCGPPRLMRQRWADYDVGDGQHDKAARSHA